MAIFRYISPRMASARRTRLLTGEVVDDPRIDYLSSHIGALEKALALGADVRGYYPGHLSIC